jgi:hypothetical protein
MIKASKKYIVLLLIILFLSIGLRAGLVRYNREANDNHDEVIRYILETGKLPEKDDCWECFQPKLFHYTTAKILQIPWIAAAKQDDSIIPTAEWINFTAGVLTLFVVAIFITRLPVKSETLKLLGFGIIALNPNLIGINSQFTNDTFAILFSTLALYCMFLFLQKQKPGTFLFVLLFTLLAISSKTNTWVIAIAIFMVMIIKAWTQKKNFVVPVLIGLVFILATLTFSTLNPLNQYISNYQKHGSPILLNMDKKPFPNFFGETEVGKPGILSIYDGFFTFKFFDLLKRPLIDVWDEYSPSRTSLWTLLYGRTHSIHFNNWPASWSTDGEEGFTLTRAIFILALLPTFLLLFGFFLELFALIKSILTRDNTLASAHQYGLAAITFTGYLCFIIIYALLYRDFTVMKAVFIFPALLGIPLFFMRAVEFFELHFKNRFNWIFAVFTTWVVALLGLYTADIFTMIQLIYSRIA